MKILVLEKNKTKISMSIVQQLINQQTFTVQSDGRLQCKCNPRTFYKRYAKRHLKTQKHTSYLFSKPRTQEEHRIDSMSIVFKEAIVLGDLRLVKYVVEEMKCSISNVFFQTFTPLTFAQHNQRFDIVQYLEDRMKPNIVMSTPLSCTVDDDQLWNMISNNTDKTMYTNKIKYLLLEFGTKEYCNRFDVGNCIEYIMGDLLNDAGIGSVRHLPNAKRVDVEFNNRKISIKYSSVGNITLHNSNSSINKDMKMSDTLLLTPDKLYFITVESLEKHGIDVRPFLDNTGESLKLHRRLLNLLRGREYKYMMNFNIRVDKSMCKNRLCSEVFYKMFENEYALK